MVRSLSSISKRSKTIKTTHKITNAMKLVSISKLQKFKLKLKQFEVVLENLSTVDSESSISDKPVLYVAFYPDLGLASYYTRLLNQMIAKLDKPKLYVLGTQCYEWLKRNEYEVLNEQVHSEHLDIESFLEICELYMDLYQIVILMPKYSSNGELSFELMQTQRTMKKRYNQVYEPNYEKANKAFQSSYLKSALVNVYYASKVVEYTIRRAAMEKATESADGMLHDLKLQYNRLRQERITEELSDLMSEEG